MPSSNTAKLNTEEDERVNTPKSKKADLSMTTSAIQSFIEEKLSGGGDVFDELIRSRCASPQLKAEFEAFIAKSRVFDGQSKEQQESFRAVTSAQFFREAIATGAGFISKRKALDHVISRGYAFSKPELKKIEDEYKEFTLDDLTSLVKSESKREKFLKSLFPGKTLPYRDIKDQIEEVFGKNVLDSKQEELLAGLLTKKYVSPMEVQEALPIFNDEQKQLLLKIFLPVVTLGQLQDMGVLTRAQVKAVIQKSITEGDLSKGFSSLSQNEKKDAVDQIDPYDLVIETMLFPATLVSAILYSDGSKAIADELSRQNTARYNEVESDSLNAIGMKPNKEGLYFPSFLEKLDALGIPNSRDLKEGAIIRGTIPGTAGKDVEFAYRVDIIAEDATINKGTAGNGRVFALTDILLSNGSLHLGKEKTKSADVTFAEAYYIFEKASTNKDPKKNIEILSPEQTKLRLDAGAIKETVLSNEIHSLDDLNRALNSLDPEGSKYPLKAEGGASIAIGTPGTADYFVYQVKSVNEGKGTIELSNGQGSEILDYINFYSNFETHKAKRLPAMKTAADFLAAMQLHSAKASDYSKLSMDGNKITSEDRKGDKKDVGITEFAGSDKYIKILDTATPGIVTFLVYDEFDEKKGLDKQKSKPVKYTGGYQLLYTFLNTEAFKPNVTPKKTEVPHAEDPHIHYHNNIAKNYLGRPSFHDIIHGAKGVLDAIKHKLEHGSHLHAANVQLALGKGMRSMGLIDAGFLREMQTGVHVKNKKLMEEMVTELKNMSGPDRQEEVIHILENKGSHDYMIQAATMAMLQKHGSLYVGKLKKWEGSFVYFERLSGQKFSENLEVVQKYRSRCDDTGEPFTEEGLIISYIKRAGENHELDGTLWTDIARAWGTGISEETTKGKDEVAKYQMGKGRTKHIMEKLEGGEKAHALGWLDGLWGGWGPAHEMHMPAIVLALSNVPSTLHQDQLNTLKNKFYGGHPYTALLFLGTKANQNVFRSVIKKLSAGNPEMAAAYEKIEKLQSHDHDKVLIKTIMKFWWDYGEVLNRKLNVTQDGELIHLAKTDTDCAAYLKMSEENAGGMKIDEGERGNGSYEDGGSFLALNPDHYMGFIKVNAGQVALEMGDETTARLWTNFGKSLGNLRTMHVWSPEATEEVQKTLYKKYHKALMSYFNNGRIEKSAYEDKLGKQDYMQELARNYGIRLTIPQGKAFLESAEYIQWMEDDFRAFKSWGRSAVATEHHTAGGVASLLEKTGYHPQSAKNA